MVLTTGGAVRWAMAVLVWVQPVLARQVEIVLLHTSDLQGHVLSLRDRERAKRRGGLLRCATMIQLERDRHSNVLLLDSGGFLRGSAESWLTNTELPKSAATWLRYDAMLPDTTWVSGDETSPSYFAPAVCSNLSRFRLFAQRLAGVEPFRVFELDGFRIAVVGLDETISTGQLAETFVMDSDDALRRVLQDLRSSHPQMVVLLWRRPYASDDHVNLQRARHMAEIFPEIHVILGSGSSTARTRKLHQAVYMDAGSHGLFVGRITAFLDTVMGNRVTLEADLLDVSHNVPEQDSLRQVLGRELAETEFRLDRIMAKNQRKLEGTSGWPGQSGIQHLVSLAMQTASHADVVLYAKRSKAALGEGAVRLSDVFRIAPTRDRWMELFLVASDLRAILEENAQWMGTASFFGCHGATYEFHRDDSVGYRIRNLRLADGKKPHGRKKLRVLVPEEALQCVSRRTVLQRLARQPINRMARLAVDTQTATVTYLDRVETIDLKPQRGMLTP